MPNQRDPDKESISLWLNSKEKKAVEDYAKKHNISRSDAVAQFIRSGLQKVRDSNKGKPPQK